jgi:hypothetical protein
MYIALRMDAPGGFYAYNYFRNDPNFLSPASASPGPVPALQRRYRLYRYPEFSISSVVANSKVTIKMHNFPANRILPCAWLCLVLWPRW